MINEEGAHSNSVINDALDKYSRLDPRDRALFVRIIHGTLEYMIRLDAIIDRYSKVKVSKMKPLIRNILRMSLYQILFMDKIPDSAVCDEAVKLVKKSALRNLSGFINGVLRSIIRDKDSIVCNGIEEQLSVHRWMYDLLAESIGEDAARRFLEYSLEEHGVTVRETGTDQLRVLDNITNLTALPEWKAGRIIVQDRSAAMPVKLAGIKPGDTVIDVCAAPGGKTIQAAEKTGEKGIVWSCDLTEKKIAKIIENLDRIRISNVKTLVRDATVFYPEFERGCDVVIADLPCSGIGTISKKPEIRNKLTMADCRTLAGIQRDILNNVCRYVKKGGRLVFSTCTLDHIENEDNTAAFLASHTDFTLDQELTIVPGDIPQDGFYIAVINYNG